MHEYISKSRVYPRSFSDWENKVKILLLSAHTIYQPNSVHMNCTHKDHYYVSSATTDTLMSFIISAGSLPSYQPKEDCTVDSSGYISSRPSSSAITLHYSSACDRGEYHSVERSSPARNYLLSYRSRSSSFRLSIFSLAKEDLFYSYHGTRPYQSSSADASHCPHITKQQYYYPPMHRPKHC